MNSLEEFNKSNIGRIIGVLEDDVAFPEKNTYIEYYDIYIVIMKLLLKKNLNKNYTKISQYEFEDLFIDIIMNEENSNTMLMLIFIKILQPTILEKTLKYIKEIYTI
jgi:hypothetical protein